MSYSLRRPEARSGVGPLTVYRATVLDSATAQIPQRWVARQGAYLALAPDPHPRIAAALARAGTAHVLKVWIELAYEAVRRDVSPAYPSRLEALYAFPDPLEAFSFNELSGSVQEVWEGEIRADVPWAVVDVSQFDVGEDPTPDEAAYGRAWQDATERARRYWAPSGEIKTAEILVGGAMTLSRRLELIPLLRELGLVADPSGHQSLPGASS